ncbi:hypothetical protein MRB53_028329 [Persea americana]|uniref:Uncharacterized protein n=1 Tax=Persea americana TaxID=3435 RepID=A0ACC2KF79_PERAE|nr:hypothetical protein MRB53_028329 [Persea americana]
MIGEGKMYQSDERSGCRVLTVTMKMNGEDVEDHICLFGLIDQALIDEPRNLSCIAKVVWPEVQIYFAIVLWAFMFAHLST